MKECGEEISPVLVLQVIFTQSPYTGTLPSDWLTANMSSFLLMPLSIAQYH